LFKAFVLSALQVLCSFARHFDTQELILTHREKIVECYDVIERVRDIDDAVGPG